ncbi:hypothetical protein DOTSEDRAFT_72689 [Dothistroma septosporum NZE10]|uniref:Transcription factor domain-containing protein n=1 Tax=Dothistroma septosporum (strain NZE10 / CBS 128990) TaxID=675120 RepID=M2XLQ0_DOTSN|nr:hypothetical protein DOTSEDRAFT_72689 [Dothistroma septosporum NZE10]
MVAPRSCLEFMIIQTPNDTNKDAFRKQVRSHVTRVQHQRSRLSAITGVDNTRAALHSDRHRVRRKKSDGQAKFRAKRVGEPAHAFKLSAPARQDAATDSPKKSSQLAAVTQTMPPIAVESVTDEVTTRAEAVVGTPRGERDGVAVNAPYTGARSIKTSAAKGIQEGAWREWTGTGFHRPVEGSTSAGIPSSPLAVMFSQGAMSARTFLLRDQDNIVAIVLNHLRLDFASVLATYKVIVQMQSKDFERNQPDMPAMRPGSTWQRFWDYIWTDPAIMIGAVLLTVTFRLQLWHKPLEHPNWYHLLQLRGFLIRTIDAAFLDPVRCTCNQMLVAVALASAFEVKYNQNMDQGYHTHMSGLVKMVRMRGGLSEIQRSDPFVERFLLWHVANTSALPRGQNVYYQELSQTSVVMRPRADTHMFQMKELLPRFPPQ